MSLIYPRPMVNLKICFGVKFGGRRMAKKAKSFLEELRLKGEELLLRGKEIAEEQSPGLEEKAKDLLEKGKRMADRAVETGKIIYNSVPVQTGIGAAKGGLI